MAYTAFLGNFAKKENSTKQPDPVSAGWAAYTVTLKDGADMDSPVISFSVDWDSVKDANYCVFGGRYYWITGKNMTRSGLCVVSLQLDPLATYKSYIGNTDFYILRSYWESDTNIKDNLYPILSEPTFNYQAITGSFPDYEDGYYILNCLGTNNNATTLYQMDFPTFKRVISNLLAQASDANTIGSSFALGVVNSLFNPIDYLNWAAWTPVPFDTDPCSTVYLGKWSYSTVTGDDVGIISDTILNITGQLSIPKHPQESRGNYLNFYPYTEYILNLQPFGIIPIDPARVSHLNIVNYYIMVDAQSGIGTLQIRDENTGSLIDSTSCKYLVDIPIGSAADGKSFLSSLVGGAAALITGNVAAGIAAGTSAIGSAAEFLSPQARTIGAQGSIAAFQMYEGFLSIFHEIAPEDEINNGRPLCKVRKPTAVPGYMVVQKGIVECPATLPMLQRIQNYLETGFYWE